MRKLVLIALALGLLAAPAFAAKGNDLPSGQKTLYNLQIIAYKTTNCPQQDAYDTGRHQIAVKADVGSNHPDKALASELIRDNDILLREGTDFRVLDGNACIDGVAEFELPNPQVGVDAEGNPTFPIYQVWLRLVGKPDTGIDVATCAIDPLDPTITEDDIVRCSVQAEQIELTRSKGKNSAPKFQNVSKELLTICADTTGDGICDTRVPLFGDAYYGYWWDWGTDGKAHAQVVFVQSPPAE
jgi:hypothetical protein